MNQVTAAQLRLARAAVAAGDYPASLGANLVEALAGSTTDADRLLAHFLGVVLSVRGPDVHGYFGSALGYSPERAVRERHHCGRHQLVFRMVLHDLPEASRDLHVCERCGPASATPTGIPPARVEIEGPATARVALPGPLRTSGWVAAGLQPIGGHVEAHDHLRPLAPGTSELEFRLSRGNTAGLRRFAAAVVNGGEFAIVQFPLEG
ncbi:hypothetical protein SAMN05421837_102202 [Amycolatopsis pretoriensis]|uniref:Uncharacterized protein n=1 Tax=Amycolatopsis pretoriensis TaxID=218821 RepID=A0A1H5QDK6_9PSEU|nr:hypothetical protein [Amycolatopsis pretoriensis]SEF23481.1 hypothetical protein SAMN05421837_102202 [Amycolatopsis pretoriensis]